MDPITKFLHNISYKFSKGYPDINNEQDILLLETELNKIGFSIKEMKQPFETLSPQSQTIGREIMDILDITEDNIKKSTQTRIIILTDENRNSVFSKLIQSGFNRNPNISGSSQGGVEKDGIQVIIKPLSKQGAFNQLENKTKLTLIT
jgi:DNA-binding transcriptional MerR regulator